MKNIICTEPCLCMENPCGARLEFWHQDGKFGLGSFYYKGVRAGAEMDQFLYEDSHYVWDNIRRIDMRSWRTPLKRA